MKKTGRRKAHFLSSVPRLGESLAAALRCYCWEVAVVADADALARNLCAEPDDDIPVMLYTDDQRKLDHWQWDVVRASHLNPVLVFGYEDEDDYTRFHRECVIYARHHAYSPIPPNILQLPVRLAKMEPVEDHLVKEGIIRECSEPHARLYLSLHSFKVKRGDVPDWEVEEVCKILGRIKLFCKENANKEICRRIDAFLMRVTAPGVGYGDIQEIKRYLETELKRL